MQVKDSKCFRANPGNSELWSAATKQDTGVWRFTDGSPLDYWPEDSASSHIEIRHCSGVHEDRFQNADCEWGRNYVCFVPGLIITVIKTLFCVVITIISPKGFPLALLSLNTTSNFHSDLQCASGYYWYQGECRGQIENHKNVCL